MEFSIEYFYKLFDIQWFVDNKTDILKVLLKTIANLFIGLIPDGTTENA